MDKLNQMLDLQRKRTSLTEAPPLIITTPTSDSNQRLSLDDNSAESVSISSKDSLEVATGQLVDLTDSVHTMERMPTPVLIRPVLSDEGDTDSASIVSSSSSSSWGGVDTVTKNEHIPESPPSLMPPVPPPRKKHLRGGEKSKGGDLHEIFELTNQNSPSSDFGSAVADALIKSSRRISDPFTAGSVSTAGEELQRALKDTTFTETGLTTTSMATPTYNSVTSDQRMPVISEMVKPPNDPWQPILTPGDYDNNPFKPGGALVAKGSPPVARGAPPLKPQPYSGSGLKNFERKKGTSSLESSLVGSLTPVDVSKLNSVGGVASAGNNDDPLGDIFGHDGLKGYAMKQQ